MILVFNMASYPPSISITDDEDDAEEEEHIEEEHIEEEEIKQAMEASLDEHAHQLQLEEVIAFSDEVYAWELQLQEALTASSNACSSSSASIATSSQQIQEWQEYDDDIQVACGKRPRSDSVLISSPKRARIENEVISLIVCGICLEAKQPSEIFDRDGCSHKFCHNCIAQHVLSKLKEKLLPISCPEPSCNQNLRPDECESFVPAETFDLWHSVLVEADIPECQKYYCPYKDCSELLLKDVPEIGSSTGAAIKESECPKCRRLFCAQCGVPWHADMDCNEYQRLSPSERGQDDLKLLKLAKEKQWQRCPKCRRIVERESGCTHMTCRCNFQFCYKCGSEWKNARVPCTCPGWTEDDEED